MSEPWFSGLVMSMQSGFYSVQLENSAENPTEARDVVCHMRGRLKRNRFSGDILAIGDRVKISIQSEGSGMIEEIEPRLRALVRLSPTPRGEYRQVLLANADQVVMVFACAQPAPRL